MKHGNQWWPAKITELPPPSYSIDPSKPVAPASDVYEVEFEEDNLVAKKPKALIRRIKDNRRQGGVIFIDECYDLDPANNPDGRSILAEIMGLAEEYRGTISVIMAGYKEDIDDKIFAFNPGMRSRFQTVSFELRTS